MRLRRMWLVLRRCESLAAFTRFVLHLRAANATTLGDTWLVKTEFNFFFCFVHLQFLDFFGDCFSASAFWMNLWYWCLPNPTNKQRL